MDAFPAELASPSGDSVIFETFAGALAEPAGGSGVFDLYNAVRDVPGWGEHRTHKPKR